VLACAAILTAGIAAWSNSFKSPFIFDDFGAIRDNPTLRHFPSWQYFVPLQARPVVQLTLALNYCLGGTGTTGYHVFNLAVHLLAALALFGIIRRTLRLPPLAERFGENAATAVAFSAALLWTIHPIQTEAVTYIVQRMESLMALFYLLTLYCFICAAEGPPNAVAWQVAAVAACALGMGSKEVMVSAPLIIVLYDRTFIAGTFREALRRRWGLYLGLAATWLILARSVFEAVGPGAPSAGFNLPGVTPLQYAQSEFGVILHYLRLAFWPAGLCLDYDWPIAHSAADIAPGAMVVGALLAATIWALVRRPKWGFAGAWFFLVLAPTSSIMPIKDLAFEHRMYLPLAAIATVCVVAAYGLGKRCVRRMTASPETRKFLGRAAATGTVLSVAGVLGWLTFDRNADYRDAVAIWQDTVNKRPENPRAWYNLADAYSRTGNADAAFPCLNKAIELKPDYVEAFNNRGVAYGKAGRLKEAMRDLDQAIALDPNDAAAYCNRGNLYAAAKRPAEAISDFDRAIKLMPDYADAYNNRGAAYTKTGHLEEAMRDLNRAIALDPDEANAYLNRAVAYYTAKDYARALSDVRTAQRHGAHPPADFLHAIAEAAGRSNPALSPVP
jgi:Tfp pilus assembly protein PilF